MEHSKEPANHPCDGKPDVTKFSFTPKSFPQIKDQVKMISWDVSKKRLHLQIDETSKMDVISWMLSVNKQHDTIEKSPFVDVESSSALLVLMNSSGKDIARIKLKNLQIKKHNCCLYSCVPFGTITDHLSHQATISYQEMDMQIVSE